MRIEFGGAKLASGGNLNSLLIAGLETKRLLKM
jgi:hypothetical protein